VEGSGPDIMQGTVPAFAKRDLVKPRKAYEIFSITAGCPIGHA